MTAGEIEDALDDAETAFQQTPTNPEVGLAHVTDESILQFRKACRFLDAAQFLLERDGHFTVIIEASFVAIERSLQYYVTERLQRAGPAAYGSVRSWGAGWAFLPKDR